MWRQKIDKITEDKKNLERKRKITKKKKKGG
jgi:hypothetical protein